MTDEILTTKFMNWLRETQVYLVLMPDPDGSYRVWTPDFYETEQIGIAPTLLGAIADFARKLSNEKTVDFTCDESDEYAEGQTDYTPRNETEQAIVDECVGLARFLIGKNRKYGNSALDPVRIFSKADAAEQIRVRIDDKLNRLAQGQTDDEDTVLDLVGYLILLRVRGRL